VRLALREEDERAERVKRFLAQPFVTWQHQNGKPGEVCALDEMLAGFERALQCS
jgi:F0F1-type ATP synthase beta subunit